MAIEQAGFNWWDQAREEFACDCAETEIRFRIFKNGQKVWVRQCLRCGLWSSPIKRESVPIDRRLRGVECDEALRRDWEERRSRRGEQLRDEWLENERAGREAAREEMREDYSEYLRSPWWRERRRLRLEFDGGRCQAQLPGCAGRASQVHHHTYKRKGNEPLFDLASICDSCHRRIHEDDDD